jgi:hypothetical protein
MESDKSCVAMRIDARGIKIHTKRNTSESHAISRNRTLYLDETQKYLDVKHEAVRAALVATRLFLGLLLRLFFPVLRRHDDAFQRLRAGDAADAGNDEARKQYEG